MLNNKVYIIKTKIKVYKTNWIWTDKKTLLARRTMKTF